MSYSNELEILNKKLQEEIYNFELKNNVRIISMDCYNGDIIHKNKEVEGWKFIFMVRKLKRKDEHRKI